MKKHTIKLILGFFLIASPLLSVAKHDEALKSLKEKYADQLKERLKSYRERRSERRKDQQQSLQLIKSQLADLKDQLGNTGPVQALDDFHWLSKADPEDPLYDAKSRRLAARCAWGLGRYYQLSAKAVFTNFEVTNMPLAIIVYGYGTYLKYHANRQCYEAEIEIMNLEDELKK